MNNILLTHKNDVLSLVLQDRMTGKTVGYMLASLDHSNVYKVVRVVADRGLGLQLYKAVMMYLNTKGLTLTSSGDEINTSSRKVWERITGIDNIIPTPLESMPSMEGIPLFLSEDDQTIDSDSFLNNSYTLYPNEAFFNRLTYCGNMKNLIDQGEDMFFKRYYN